MRELSELRHRIDHIDKAISQLFLDRIEVSRDIAEYKRAHGSAIFDPARERANIAAARTRVPAELASYAATLQATLMEASRDVQHRSLNAEHELVAQVRAALNEAPAAFPANAHVACQGAEGAYSQIAVERLFRRPSLTYFDSFEAVFLAVEQGMAEYGVLPIENSTAGSLNQVYDLMMRKGFHIVRSCDVKTDHDPLNNYTRFACIAKHLAIFPEADRSSFIAVVRHEPGALHNVLARFYARGINLVKLESRPIPNQASKFMFYIEAECPVATSEFSTLLNSLGDACEDLRYLGSYTEVM